MTIYQTILAVGLIFAIVGMHQATGRLLRLVDSHLERFQAKLDLLVKAQNAHNFKLDAILGKLL